MFLNDLYMIICALLRYIRVFQQILFYFGQATGLVCHWNKMVALVIPVGPPPLSLLAITMDLGN